VLALLQRYQWPGNVRELQHAVERAVILTSGSVLMPGSFEPIRAAVSGRKTPMAGLAAALTESKPDDLVVLNSLSIEHAESMLIQRALVVTGGNRTRAAELLGVSVRTLRNKLSSQTVGQKS
jgi:DNA-binding NtrC family response regulator